MEQKQIELEIEVGHLTDCGEMFCSNCDGEFLHLTDDPAGQSEVQGFWTLLGFYMSFWKFVLASFAANFVLALISEPSYFCTRCNSELGAKWTQLQAIRKKEALQLIFSLVFAALIVPLGLLVGAFAIGSIFPLLGLLFWGVVVVVGTPFFFVHLAKVKLEIFNTRVARREAKAETEIGLLRLCYEEALSKTDKADALKKGRDYYSALRGDGSLTIYDEQAIANDLKTMKGI